MDSASLNSANHRLRVLYQNCIYMKYVQIFLIINSLTIQQNINLCSICIAY